MMHSFALIWSILWLLDARRVDALWNRWRPESSKEWGIHVRGGAYEDDDNNDGFHLISDTVLYEKWRKLIRRQVRLPSGLLVDFEIAAQSSGRHRSDDGDNDGTTTTTTDQAVVVFVWNTETQTATLIREYMPSVHRKMFGVAAGMVETEKHVDDKDNDDDTLNPKEKDSMQLTAAKFELEEECRLTGGQWIQLTDRPVVMDKYSTTALTAYLVLDPVPVPSGYGKPRDATEEGMEVIQGVTIGELRNMITMSSEMTIVGSWASLLALDKLQELKFI
jgi:hypothetical protein